MFFSVKSRPDLYLCGALFLYESHASSLFCRTWECPQKDVQNQ